MGKWFPAIYDLAMKPLEKGKFRKIRTELIHKASGRVLEIGAGTGINFPLYQNVEHVDAIEPNPTMVEKSKARRKRATVSIQLHGQTAEELDFDDDTFDTVIATLVFCTIPDPMKALKEIQRVCKPGGTVLFFEHVKMKQPFMGQLQELLNPFWKKICDGCHLNRDTLGLVKASEFQVTKVTPYYKELFLTIECVNRS